MWPETIGTPIKVFILAIVYIKVKIVRIVFLIARSENIFEVNHVDNRQRTPLHNAAAKGDNGVLEGLL